MKRVLKRIQGYYQKGFLARNSPGIKRDTNR